LGLFAFYYIIMSFLCIRNGLVKMKMFADDVKIYYSFSIYCRSNVLRKDIAVWASLWQLTTSVDKTFMLHLGTGNPRHIYSVNGVYVIGLLLLNLLEISVCNVYYWKFFLAYACNRSCEENYRLANTMLHAFRCHNVKVCMLAFT
jgi:hypothetical protein